jgi:integrase
MPHPDDEDRQEGLYLDSAWLQERNRARAKLHGPLIFGAHQTENVNVITDLWRRKLNRLWALCGPWDVRPTPHRCRHTFARILLQKPGVTVRDVAELMGDTEATILKYCSAWIAERQARLTRILKEAFEDSPNLVAIDGGKR